MIWSVAWRNIWRNKGRSNVIIAAITVGIFAGVFIWAFYNGMVAQRVQSAITTESSHIQIHHKDYLSDPDPNLFMEHTDSIAELLQSLPEVKAVSRRMIVNSMIASAETGSGVKIIAVDPEEESLVTNIWEKIDEGSYLDGGRTPIVIGRKLAEKLSAELRSRVVLTLQTMDSTITQGLFRVSGIYKTSNTLYDESTVFIRKSDLINLIGIDSHAGHEIAVLLNENNQLGPATRKISSMFPDTDVKTWRELMPEVTLIEENMDTYMYFFMIIVLVALIFGIINTMLMAVLERVKELGMLMAVGMNKKRVFKMIVLETVMLSCTGGLAGILLANGVVLFFSRKGIDLSLFAEGIEKLGFESIVYPQPDTVMSMNVAFMFLITGIIASVYPAMKAIRLKPAEALHMDN